MLHTMSEFRHLSAPKIIMRFRNALFFSSKNFFYNFAHNNLKVLVLF